ncbi:serine protease inhibitor 28Dc-like isoform X1 [Uranotaenia lowii]|uniref:serine protease inhibitor 28Dc-like isoform X1 n=1 Tax=Uranotaenia lowii TaxID=190385 RepID=UPI0024797788|nr:serine protease inhibitor 28Dc-like isoform X1 [Uranotaenia lowii]
MRLKLAFSLTLLIAIQSVTCQNQHNRQRGNVNDESQKLNIVADSVTNLAQKISNAITSQKSKTEIFSPVSIAGALSLLLLGASGTTRTELENVMGFDSRISFTDIHKSFGKLFRELVTNDPILKSEIPWRATDKCNNYDYDDDDVGMRGGFQAPQTPAKRPKRQSDSHIITVANGLFASEDLRLNASGLAKHLYDADIRQMDFSRNPVGASDQINQWVSQKTRGKIQDVTTPSLVQQASMVLVNTLYFKAKWETMFLKLETKPKPFYIDGKNQSPVQVLTMATSGCFPLYEDKVNNFKIVGLPYMKQRSTMYLLLPNDSSRSTLQYWNQQMTINQFNELIDRMVVKSGTISMPVMKLENTVGLKNVLLSLGLRSAFDPDQADFSAFLSNAERLESLGARPQEQHSQNPAPFPVNQQNEQDDRIQFPAHIKRCALISHCSIEGTRCMCNLAQNADMINNGCHEKPFYLTRGSCQRSLVSVGGVNQCLSATYQQYRADGNQCTSRPGCYFTDNACYCCFKSEAPTQPVNPNFMFGNRDGASDQSNSNNPNGFGISNRFQESETPPSSQAPSQSITDFVIVCQIKFGCDQLGRCGNFRHCFQQRQPRRMRRQAQRPKLSIGQIIHKISLDINEEGTEGGAVTAVVIDRISSAFTLRIDGPFLLYLRDDVHRLPLFYGPVYDPRS